MFLNYQLNLLIALLACCGLLFPTASSPTNAWATWHPVCPTSANDTTERFQWKLNPEDEFNVELNQRMVTVTSIDRREVAMENMIQLRQYWHVQQPDADNNFRIRQTIESIRLRVGNPQFPDQAFVIDSQSDQRPHRDAVELNRQVKGLVGISFLLTMRASGEIVTAELEPESKTKLENIEGDNPLKSLLNAQGMAQALSGVTIMTSSESSEPRSIWSVEDEIKNSFGSFTRQRNYRITKTEKIGEREIVTIGIESVVSPKKIEFDGSALLDSITEMGEMHYDTANGIFTHSQMKQSINSRLQYAGELLKMELNSETEIRIRKRD